MKLKTVIIVLLLILLILVFLILAECQTSQTTKTVNCDDGDSLSEFVAESRSGTRIIVNGTCRENKAVVVTRDAIIIDGKGTAVIDGKGNNRPVLTIKGAKGVVINGLTVKNGKLGIASGLGAKTVLKDVIVTENTRNGIVVSKTGKLPGKGEPNPDIKQQKPAGESAPLSFNLSPIGEAVADDFSYPCSCVDKLLNDGGDSGTCTAALEDNTMVVCGAVSSVGNGWVGMYVLSSDLITEGRLTLADNGYYAGLYVGNESTITVTGNGAISAEGNTGSGVHVYESTMFVSGALETSNNSGLELFIEEADAYCRKPAGDIRLISSDENRNHCE